MTGKNLAATTAIREAIQNIAVGPDRGRDISRDLAHQVLQAILDNEVDEVQAAVFLIAMRMKRESVDEFRGLYTALQASAAQVTAEVDQLICLADPFDGYVRNVTMTPFIAPVLAACGYAAVMHGVETVGPKHGITAHKIYKLAGINALCSLGDAASNVQNVGWTYIDQRIYAPQLYALQSLRDRIVKRTALTTLERLLIPIKARKSTHLVLGYVHKAYPDIYAKIAQQAGFASTLLLKGVEGGLAPALNKPLRRFYFDGDLPESVDEEKQILELDAASNATGAAEPVTELATATESCLEMGLSVLAGAAGTARDSLSLAAGHIVMTHNKDLSLSQAVEKVQFCLDNGSAKACFDAMISSR